MAKFKVGDRVRKVRPFNDADDVPVGAQGTIRVVGPVPSHRPKEQAWDYAVDYDGLVANINECGLFYADAFMLAPLTPPAEDTWAADKVKELLKPPRPMDLEREPAREYAWRLDPLPAKPQSCRGGGQP